MILQATHTHLYPGHRGAVYGLTRIAELPAGGACTLEFSDGAAAAARISQGEEGWRLDTGAYRTAAGTEIPAKRWLVALQQAGERVEFRIICKAQAD